MNVILFDPPVIRENLLPFTFTRPVAKIRVGILTIDEKWAHWLNTAPSFNTQPYLQKKFPLTAGKDNLLINGALCPDENLMAAIKALDQNQVLIKDKTILVARQNDTASLADCTPIAYEHPVTLINHVWEIFQKNASQLKVDFHLITKGRTSSPIEDKHTIVYGEENIFIEEGVTIKAAILNAETGPIYLGKHSSIGEGSIIRGSFSLGEGSAVNLGAKLRGDITVGPYSKVGGEISNSVIFGYSNKAHDGFLGNSVIGEWCNFGADSNTSNLKNNYDHIKLWNHPQEKFIDTGNQFCGLMMGDHSKCGINTMFNSGTVVDVSSNVFGAGFPRNYIPSFSWGGPGGLATYQLDKALETAARVMKRRGIELNTIETEILTYLFDQQNKKTQ